MAAIPLHCNICPKKPNFSDVSHLLTHIASKGHLSNYYKVKVRSGSEEASRRLIEAYDRWYAEWNVEDLMSERMSQKDKRRTRARPSARLPPSAPPEIQAPAPRPAQTRLAVSSLLDPRLSEQQVVKTERSVTPSPTPFSGPALRHRPFASRVQYWPMGSRSTSRSYTNPDYETSSEYSEPYTHRGRYQYTAEDSCAIEEEPPEASTNTMEDPLAANEATKLKGVYWPGMDLFDSATPEMRRKRNQKKDSSVVEQLEINSQGVEATELIFTPQGSFKRQRRISSSVYDDEESSPLRGDSPKSYLTRPALGSVDANVGMRPRQGMRPPSYSYSGRHQHDREQIRSAHGHGDRAPRSKRAFDVFQDEDTPFSQPTGMHYLTSGYQRHRVSPSPAPVWAAYKSYGDGFAFDNKENIPPSYFQSGYDHHSQGPGSGYHHCHAYSYGLGQENHTFHYQDNVYLNQPYHQAHHEETDDQRTLTAPPSPSSG